MSHVDPAHATTTRNRLYLDVTAGQHLAPLGLQILLNSLLLHPKNLQLPSKKTNNTTKKRGGGDKRGGKATNRIDKNTKAWSVVRNL